MERSNLITFQKLAGSIEKNREVLKAMDRVAPMHAMALVIYHDCGGYDRVFNQLFYDIAYLNTIPTQPIEARLVSQSRTLLEKAATTIRMLQNDGVLTPAMERQIRDKYLHHEDFVKLVKHYLHQQVRFMIGRVL